MKSHPSRRELTPLIALCAAFALALTSFDSHAADPIMEGFFSPEQIMSSHEQLGLTDSQGATLKSAFDDAHQRMEGMQQQMQAESKKLAELAKPERVDEKAVIAQADKMLDLEREMKHTQLSLLVVIKNTLTADQQAKLTALKKDSKGSTAGLEEKVQKVKDAAQRWQQEGRDLSPILAMKGEVEALMAQGKTAEVSAVLDKALKILNGEETK